MTAFDVAVVGMGPAGAAAAQVLAAAGRSVVLLGKPADPRRRVGEVLTPAIGPLLVQLGIWERFVACDPRPVHAIWSAWGGRAESEGGAGGVVSKDFVASPHGPAWRVDRLRFDELMVAAAIAAGVRTDARFGRVAARRVGDAWRLGARGGGKALSIEARFVVDATGRTAAVARASGARWLGHDRAVAVAALLEPKAGVEVAADDVLLVESVADGWWYSSVLPSGELVAVLVTDNDLLHADAGPVARSWSRALARTELTALRAAGFRRRAVHVWPAGRGRLDRACGPGWVAVGDAASAIDPLTGAGITKALREAAIAAKAVNEALAGDRRGVELYADRVRVAFETSFREGSDYYRQERRWPQSRFWQRRQLAEVSLRRDP